MNRTLRNASFRAGPPSRSPLARSVHEFARSAHQEMR